MQLLTAFISLLLCCQQVPDTLGVARISADRSTVSTGAAPVRSATAGQIGRAGMRSMDEVLRRFAGVSVKDYGGIGGLKTVSIRNFGAQHTAVVYNGVVVPDIQNGQIDISHFDLENLESLSVSIGGNADIFRSARTLASTGVLEIRNRRPELKDNPFSISSGMRIASFSTYNPYLSYNQCLGDRWTSGISLNYLNSRGAYPFTLVNGDRRTRETRHGSDVSSLRAEVGFFGNLAHDGKLDFRVNAYLSERGLPGVVILYAQNPSERLWDRNLSASALYEKTFGQGWRLSANLSYSNAWNRYLNTSPLYPKPEDDRYLQQEYAAGMILQKTLGENLKLAFAADAFADILWSDIPECPFPTRFTAVPAVSAQYDRARLSLVASISGTLLAERVKTGEAAPSRARVSPSLSAVYRITDSLRLRASVRDGYRVPTFNDLYYARVGNRNIQPEKALQINAGIVWLGNAGRFRWQGTADMYYNEVRDKIVAVPTMFIWKMRNAGRVRMAGADLALTCEYMLSRGMALDFEASYSFQYAVDVTDPAAKNYLHQIPYTPRHTGGLSMTFVSPWVNFSYNCQAVGRRYSMNQNIAANEIMAYADHGISLNRKFNLGRGVSLDAGLEALNLADVNYEVIKYYPMPGRSYRLTVKISY